MKSYWLGIMALILSGSVSAKEAVVDEAFLEGLSNSEIASLHANHCGTGVTGWWIELSVGSVDYETVSGGINTTTGTYYGCGTCAQCRVALADKVARNQASRKQSCEYKGGTEHSATSGQRVEKTNPSDWEIRQEGIYSKCKKWVPC